jgi:hypothetical protein
LLYVVDYSTETVELLIAEDAHGTSGDQPA